MKFSVPQLLGPALMLCAMAVPSFAAELVVVEQPGCVWCARFNAEIAPAWPNTAEGRRAPLRRVDITEPWPADLEAVQKERATPTFILMDKGREIGRLRGYPGDQFFWFRIDELLAKLPPEGEQGGGA